MLDRTIVLSSARAIRSEQLKDVSSTQFLPYYITMSDFISKLTTVDGYCYIESDSRTLLLLEASDFDGFKALQIERNFFTFTKNSSYIFNFFEELSAELYDIDNLLLADTYAEYEEHISILQELYKRYEKLCNERKLLDKIFLPKLYSFNAEYMKRHKIVEIYLEGYLTNFEYRLLDEAKSYAAIEIVFTTTQFNSKMQKRFLELGIALEQGYRYRISLNRALVLSKRRVDESAVVVCESLSEPLLQVAFVKQKIYEFIRRGHKAKNIAVVVPNEHFAPILKSFDTKGNFNFAMGDSFVNSEIYRELNAVVQRLDQDSKENIARVQRVGERFLTTLAPLYHKKGSDVDIIALLEEFLQSSKQKSEAKIFAEEMYAFEKLLPFMREMSLKSLLSLFMQRVASRTIDDVRGGQVTVMGVLETRGVSFDGVIIVDFDAKNVPKRSDKDMFLNSKIRESANLPTMNDRESLQKHYYRMLISNSKEVAISYVDSSENTPSVFLKQLGLKAELRYSELDYANILFQRVQKEPIDEPRVEMEYSFEGVKLSATRLNSYLTCKRKYYYKYIKQINQHTIPKDMPQEYEIGNSVHNALKELYSKKNCYSNRAELERDLHSALNRNRGESELDSYLIAMQKKRLEPFCTKEIERFNAGWRVHSCEEKYSTTFHGMELIGQIDRVDKRLNEVAVLDYKTGSYKLYNKSNFTEATDFQLEFYYLLTSALGSVSECGFYDLKESQIVPEAFLHEKLEILQSHIKDLKRVEHINFEKCEDTKQCLYCEYATICGRV